MRLLCSVKNNQKKIKVKVPKIDVFIHKCYIYTARELWQTIYLFDETKDKLKKQENNKKIEDIIIKSIENVIRKLLPIKTILNDYLETNLTETTEAEINNSLINIINENQENKIKHYDENESHKTTNSEENTLNNNENINKEENTINNPNLITENLNESKINNTLIEDNNEENDNKENSNFFDELVDTPNTLYDNNKVINLNPN